MKAKINTYFAILLITIAGAGATLVILRFIDSTQYNFVAGNGYNEASYAPLQQQILNQN